MQKYSKDEKLQRECHRITMDTTNAHPRSTNLTCQLEWHRKYGWHKNILIRQQTIIRIIRQLRIIEALIVFQKNQLDETQPLEEEQIACQNQI